MASMLSKRAAWSGALVVAISLSAGVAYISSAGSGGELDPGAARSLTPVAGDDWVAQANPCNPCAGKNPCNPCAGKNPCNPCAGKNPCNPCAGKNPCNPCAGKNPCNPCAGKNPCGMGNPCAGTTVDPDRVRQGTRALSGRADLALGEKLWNDRFLGKTGLACSTCHIGNYMQMQPSFRRPYPHRVEMPAIQAGLPQVNAAEMVQFCMVVPMVSDPLPWGSNELASLAAYVESIQGGYSEAAAGLANPNPCSPKNPCNPCAGRNPCNP